MKYDSIFSIICPTLNEEKHIGNIIGTFIEYCPQPSELLIADAGSTDQTRKIIADHANRNSNILLIDNPDKYVSFGFNKAFAASKGRYIGLLGAHTHYPGNYFQAALYALETEDCDVVGGPLQQIGSGAMGQAIAYCMSTKMGVGNTAFRTSQKRQYVDSVAFAIYKRSVFEKVGLLDTELVRNQDDELHYRINAAGFKILMIPEMQCEYQVRDTIPKLFRQYYEYGLYKPLVLKKVKSGIKVRHLIPALFVLYLLSLPIVFLFPIWLIPGLLYILLVLYFSTINSHPILIKTCCLIVYPVLHISYGIGFLKGITKLMQWL